MDEIKKIVIISDGTGGTAMRLMDAVLVQYDESDLKHSVEKTYPQVRTREQVDIILTEIDEDYLVLYTVISAELSDYIRAQLSARAILHLNVLKPMLDIVSKFLGVHPDYRPGILQILDDRYYGRIDAIRYTVQHDDGRGSLIEQADVVLLGLSRSCKTPISVFLACNHGLKVANIPVVNENDMTENMLERLRAVDPNKIIGLLMRPERLAQLREERSSYLLGKMKYMSEPHSYYDAQMVDQEYRYCRNLYLRHEWPTIDVTHQAIEEASKKILEMIEHSDTA